MSLAKELQTVQPEVRVSIMMVIASTKSQKANLCDEVTKQAIVISGLKNI